MLFYSFSIADSNNGNDIIDFKYCFPGRLTITEFVLLSLVMLEDSDMLDTYVGEILNNIQQRITQEQLMNYNAPTSTDIYLSPQKHLQLISAQYTFYSNTFYSHCYAKLSWTNSSIFLDGLLDNFKLHGKISFKTQKRIT